MNDNTKEWDGQEKYILFFLSGLRMVKVNIEPQRFAEENVKAALLFQAQQNGSGNIFSR